MSETRDDYAFWRAGLAGITMAVQDGHPQPGFYRTRRSKGSQWQPVAIWRHEGALYALCGEASVEPTEIWIGCARHPVTEADYRHAATTGTWPGAIVEAEPAAAKPVAVTLYGIEEIVGPAPPDHNKAPADEPGAALMAEIDETVSRAKSWLVGRTIVSQADADACEAWIASLSKTGKAAEQQHKVEKAPHLEAGRAVDARWKPVLMSCEGAVRMLKAALTPFLRQREVEKREQASKAIAAGAQPVRSDVRATTSGTHGRKVSMRTRRRAEIKDYPAALAFFADHPEVKALVQTLAQKVASVGGTVPGVEVITEQEAA